jgi:transposase
MDLLLAEWALLDEQLARVDQQIALRHRQNPRSMLLASVPGFSQYSSLAIACRASQIERFPRGASLANFYGLVPGCRNSGEANDRIGSITKQGSSMVRFLLGQAVLHVLRKDAWMRNWYRRVKGRRGSKVARVAVMRKLATTLWYVLKNDVPYTTGGPQAVRAACERLAQLRVPAQSSSC